MKKAVFNVLLVAMILLGVFGQEASAQMSVEADEICKRECVGEPLVVMYIPKGEEPQIRAVKGEGKKPGFVEISVHSTKDSREVVCKIPFATDKVRMHEMGWGRRGLYGTEWNIEPNSKGSLRNPVRATLGELHRSGVIKLGPPQKTKSGVFVLRPCKKWTKQDSGLKPLTTSRIKGEMLLGLGVQSGFSVRNRRCASCEKWWVQWMRKHPDAWENRRVHLVPQKRRF